MPFKSSFSALHSSGKSVPLGKEKTKNIRTVPLGKEKTRISEPVKPSLHNS